MKKTTLFAAVLSAFTALTIASQASALVKPNQPTPAASISDIFGLLPSAGTYAQKHAIAIMWADEAECKEEGNTWDDGMCVADTEDTVVISKDGKVEIETISSNAHMCSYEGQLQKKGLALVAIEKGEEPGDGICKITVRKVGLGSKTVSVKAEGEYCRYFCGANAMLDIDEAVRK